MRGDAVAPIEPIFSPSQFSTIRPQTHRKLISLRPIFTLTAEISFGHPIGLLAFSLFRLQNFDARHRKQAFGDFIIVHPLSRGLRFRYLLSKIFCRLDHATDFLHRCSHVRNAVAPTQDNFAFGALRPLLITASPLEHPIRQRNPSRFPFVRQLFTKASCD